ncbi:MAG TPA: glutaredoxin family protein [Actinomycetota bacterium]|nr:glutaredoxin family protein [Actinomycetota bacterium]
MVDGIVIYGADWCGDCRRAKRVFERLRVDYRWIDVEHDAEKAEEARRIGGSRRIPVIILPDQTILVEPTDAELEQKLGS